MLEPGRIRHVLSPPEPLERAPPPELETASRIANGRPRPLVEPPFLSIYLTHSTATLEEMEPITAIPTGDLLLEARSLPGASEAVVLKTCNRVELYLATSDPDGLERAATTWLSGYVAPPLLRTDRGIATCDHLLRVASGLESMLIGEDQILGQVRQAHEIAERDGATGRELSRLFAKAVQVGKKVRAETAINKGSLSVGRAAVKLASSEAGGLSDKRVVIVGTGEMAALVAKGLQEIRPAEVVVVSKTAARAALLASEIGATPVEFSRIAEPLGEADVVITATSGTETLFDRALLQAWNVPRKRPLLFIDVSNPRNVSPDVETLPLVRLFNLDSLRAIAAENLARRRAEVRRAGEIVSRELALFSVRLAEERAEETLSKLYGRMKAIRDVEVERAARKLDLDENGRNVLQDLANSMLNKILANPTIELKRMARENDAAGIRTASELFRLEEDAK